MTISFLCNVSYHNEVHQKLWASLPQQSRYFLNTPEQYYLCCIWFSRLFANKGRVPREPLGTDLASDDMQIIIFSIYDRILDRYDELAVRTASPVLIALLSDIKKKVTYSFIVIDPLLFMCILNLDRPFISISLRNLDTVDFSLSIAIDGAKENQNATFVHNASVDLPEIWMDATGFPIISVSERLMKLVDLSVRLPCLELLWSPGRPLKRRVSFSVFKLCKSILLKRSWASEKAKLFVSLVQSRRRLSHWDLRSHRMNYESHVYLPSVNWVHKN